MRAGRVPRIRSLQRVVAGGKIGGIKLGFTAGGAYSFLPQLVTVLKRHGHLTLDGTVRARVLAASAATLDRLLRSTRASVSGQRGRRRAVPAVQKNVPVRTFAEWEDSLPGDMEADLVSHGGDCAPAGKTARRAGYRGHD